jgi:hypothetical protein
VKLNLGCGHERLEGWLNVDKSGTPELVVDLEQFPWPWADSSVEAVRLHHVLEHLGETTASYLGVLRELYRVCQDGARVFITVPHPRHDDFLIDPTHVRPILAESFQLLSRRRCLDWKARGIANTPLALYLDVDFEVEKVAHTLDALWQRQLEAGKMTTEELGAMAQQVNNVIKQTDIELRVLKPA